MHSQKTSARAAASLLVAIGLAAAGQGVAAATTITPPSTATTVTGVSSPALTLRTTGFTLQCYTFTAEGQTPASGDTVTLDQADVDVSSCLMNGQYLANVAVHDDLTLTVDYNGGNPQGTLSIPAGGMTASYSGAGGTCNLAVDASDIGPVPYSNATGRATATGASGVNFTSTVTGSIPCPASGTALVDTTLELELAGGGNPIIQP